MHSRLPLPSRITETVLVSIVLLTGGCRVTVPEPPSPREPALTVTGEFPAWPLPAGGPLRPPPGSSRWSWTTAGGTRRAGEALLSIDARGWRWRLFPAPVTGDSLLHLVPRDSAAWHDQLVNGAAPRHRSWFPLARRPVGSPHYADLLDMLLDLASASGTTEIRHWPHYPVIVGGGPAISGAVDLTACLTEGIAWWDRHQPGLFVWRPDTVCDVRLVHIPGHVLHPAMSVHLLRRDDEGRPLRMTIRTGDTYADARDRPFARRALLHELTHVSGLWGHSPDRRHILWRAGPIVDVPDTDETAAVRWWLSLPEGLDLSRYGRRGELDPPGALDRTGGSGRARRAAR